MKRLLTVFIFFMTCVYIQAQDFTWDLKFLKGRSNESVPVSQIIRMGTGETFQFTVNSDVNVYCYIICYDSQRQIMVMFDQQLTALQEAFFGPFRLTKPSGTETIYVIMSQGKQSNLETLIRNFRNNPQTRRHTNNLHREVVNLQNSVSRLGEPASSFIPSDGTTRGNTQPFVTRFSEKNMYVRAITIRH